MQKINEVFQVVVVLKEVITFNQFFSITSFFVILNSLVPFVPFSKIMSDLENEKKNPSVKLFLDRFKYVYCYLIVGFFHFCVIAT